MLDLILMLGITLGTAGFVGAPFMHRQRSYRAEDSSASPSADLLLQKDTLYTAIRDLEFDFQTGKVDQQDYVELRQQLEQEAVHVLRLLDALDPCAPLEAAREQHIAPLHHRPPELAPVAPAGVCRSCGAELQRPAPGCPSCVQEPGEREEKYAVRPPA
jgi:hypothetical protein